MNEIAVSSPPPQHPAESTLAQSWALFRAHWKIVLAPLAVAVIVWIVVLAIAGGALLSAGVFPTILAQSKNVPPALLEWLGAVWLALLIVGVLLALWTFSAIFGIADALWERGGATLADGAAAFRRSWGALLAACIGIAGLAILAVLLALPTLGLALLALPLAIMYVPAAVVSGRRGGFDAIGESFRLVRRFFGASAITLIVLVAIRYGLSFLSLPFMLPLQVALMTSDQQHRMFPSAAAFVSVGAGMVVSSVLTLVYYGYYAITITGLYRRLALSSPAAPDVAPPLPA